MDCPKCEEPMTPQDGVFWLPRHEPNNTPLPISTTQGLRVRVYWCEECGYVLLEPVVQT